MFSSFLLLLSLFLLMPTPGCLVHQGGADKKKSKVSDELDEEGEEDELEEDEGDEGGNPDSSNVSIKYQKLPEAVEESSTGGQPKKNITRLREALCEEHASDAVIFYQFIASQHWHYYWLCSDYKARRATSKAGVRRLRKWLEGFKNKARVLSRDCPSGSETQVLTGPHESGITATALCNGRVILAFPDGGQTTTYFSSMARSTTRADPGSAPSTSDRCPPCPSCARGAEDCPACPRPPPCPQPPPCPACDCKPKMLEAGKAGFKQGVEKACKKICQLIYKKCRSIDPNTALCYQTSEYCSTQCGK